MNFLAFQKYFAALPVISISEIEKYFPEFDPNALTRWQKAGYLKKIRNGFYRIDDKPLDGEAALFLIANRIYAPSYISLQSALSWYGFIPEGVFTVTSVSTLKTNAFTTPIGQFSYRTLKSSLFWGYMLESSGAYYFRIAHPAKALLDFFYLFPEIATDDQFHELRLNPFELKERLQPGVLKQYAGRFNTKSLETRVDKFLNYLTQAHDIVV